MCFNIDICYTNFVQSTSYAPVHINWIERTEKNLTLWFEIVWFSCVKLCAIHNCLRLEQFKGSIYAPIWTVVYRFINIRVIRNLIEK